MNLPQLTAFVICFLLETVCLYFSRVIFFLETSQKLLILVECLWVATILFFHAIYFNISLLIIYGSVVLVDQKKPEQSFVRQKTRSELY